MLGGPLRLTINDRSDSGGTALMYAAGGGHASVCELLIKEGADLSVLVKAKEEYLLRVAESKTKPDDLSGSRLEVIDVEHSDGGTALTVAAESGFFSVVETLVLAGINVNTIADDNFTAFTYAFKGGFENITLFLLEHGADPNQTYTDSEVVKFKLHFIV